MKKIINIRLGNYVLTMDEDASDLINKYTEALKQKYKDEPSAFEIVSDIEERIGELLAAKQKNTSRNYSTIEDARDVLLQMGPVEEMENSDNTSFNNSDTKRKLYRDSDNRILGGVCGGLAAYLDIDPTLLRIGWFLLLIFFGIGFPLYIILWVVMPLANTATEKMAMRGQAPTLRNFEDAVRSEYNNVKERVTKKNNVDNITTLLRSLIEYFGKFVILVTRFFLSAMGLVLLAILIGVLLLITTDTFHVNTYNIIANGRAGIDTFISLTGNPFWIKIGIISFILISIALVSLKTLVSYEKRNTNRLPIRILSGINFVILIILVVLGINGARLLVHRSEQVVYHETIPISGDTLYINSTLLDKDQKGLMTLNTFAAIMPSDDSNFHIEQSNIYYGSSRSSSYTRARKMDKMYIVQGNKIVLNEGRVLKDLKSEGIGWGRLTLYVPVGKTVKKMAAFGFLDNDYTEIQGNVNALTMDSNGQNRINFTTGINKLQFSNSVRSIKASGKFDIQLIPSNFSFCELVSGPVINHPNWVQISNREITLDDDYLHLPGKASVVRIYMPNPESIDISGVCRLNITKLQVSDLRMEVSGASEIYGSVVATRLALDVTGASNCTISGSSQMLDLNISGASHYHGGGLFSEIINMDATGASTATIWCNKSVKGDISGASKLEIKGPGEYSELSHSGASSISREP